MNPTERINAVAEGKELDRVQMFFYITDLGPAYQVLGFPRLSDAKLQKSGIGKFVLGKLGMWWPGRLFMQSEIKKRMFTCIEAAVKLGFDATIGMYSPSFSRFPDVNTLQDDWGSHNVLSMEADGTGSYFYGQPKITTPEEYNAWPCFPDPDTDARKTYKMFRKVMDLYGERFVFVGM